MTALIQCLECYAFMSETAVDDMDLDQCPTCGEYTSFDHVDSIDSEGLTALDDFIASSAADDALTDPVLVCRKCGEQPEVITDIDYNYCDSCGFTGYLQEAG